MTDLIMSKKTFANAANAEVACAKAGKTCVKTHQLPSGRFCYIFEIVIPE